MDADDEAGLKVLRWRVESLRWRIAQVLLIGLLCWLDTRSPAVVLWAAATMGLAFIDWGLTLRWYARPTDRRRAALSHASRTLAAGAFAAVCFIVLIDSSNFGLAASILLGCAINLNNAMMTRGSRIFTVTLVGPSSVVLLTVPVAALWLGHPITLVGCIILLIGTAGYTVFIASLASTLHKESEALRLALVAAEASSLAKSAFLAMASHEIRTPLNGVLGMAQAMAHEPLSPAQQGRVGVIRQSGEALLHILNDILDLSKIEAGKLELETAPFDLEAVVKAAHDGFAILATDKGLAYRILVDESARGRFDGDAARVRQVLCNLISNAVKFTEAGEVEVAVRAHAAGVSLSVRDSGPGVDAGRAERLFEKFVQADSSTTRRFGGTGLGLAICRELCEAMGGTIGVKSVVGQGSTFAVELPILRSAAAQAAPTDEAAAGAVFWPDSGLRVLAAEDNAVNQLVLRTLLQQIGLEPVIVGNGALAVEAWAEGGFDLILMDVQMPEMDGPTAARAIRARERETGRTPIPIIALTANAMSHQVAEYLAAGMDALVAKPIEVAQLYAAIGRYSDGAGAKAVAVG